MALTLGDKTSPNRRTYFTYPLTIPAEDLWSAWIVGQPGFGKSTFLGNLAEAFADEGEGVLLLDIKGDLAEQVASRTKHRDRVIYLDPATAHEMGRYYAFNPLDFDRTKRLNFELYGNSLFETFVYIGEVSPELMKTIRKVMTEAINLALARRATTLTDIYLILHDEEHRRRFLSAPGVPPQTLHYWLNVFPSSDREQRHAVDSTDSRIRAIMKGPYLSYMLNQPRSTLKFVEWLDQGKIVICDFNQGRLSPSTAKRLGNLILGYLAGEIVKRPTGQTAARWRLIVDEAHELATLPFADMVTQMRTYNAFPVIASQSRTQMEKTPELASAADQTSAQFELMLSERDAANLRWTRSEAAVNEARTREQYTAHYRLTKRPKDTDFEGVLALRPWHGEVIPGQLDALRHQGVERATPKAQLRDLFAFEAFAKAREEAKVNEGRKKATGPMASGPGAGKKGSAGSHQARGADPGAARSGPNPDSATTRPPVFHRPYPGQADPGKGTGSSDESGES